jgi:hypothetical protein
VPGKFIPVEFLESDTSAAGAGDGLYLLDSALTSGEIGTLEAHVAGLVKMIFNLDTMRSTLLEMNIDAIKLPLAALSRARLLSGCSILSQISALIEEGGESLKDASASLKMKIIDGSNHFYTIVPHNFGTKAVPVIETAAQVQQHMKTMEALLEMETATKLIRLSQLSNTGILDSCFAKLHVDMAHIPAHSSTFNILDTYLKRTLASTHKAKYDLAILDAFSVSRHSESDRFEPWFDLHNHQLLWHGSRVSNFVGVLSQGLRIAPPEAPVTGYMFGKVRCCSMLGVLFCTMRLETLDVLIAFHHQGIYFANMASKSANDCAASPEAPTGSALNRFLCSKFQLSCSTCFCVPSLSWF